jgi:GDP-4-dehydro-6-deoxy-D-mannose reductase
MNVLLIGGTGFVGGHLKRDLLDHNYTVDIHDESIDIRNAEQLNREFAGKKYDSVVHLAAQSSVPDSFKYPRETFEINFMGTLNVLTALQGTGFKGRMLYIGSGDVYGLLGEHELPVSEERPLKPNNPYSVSKVAAEALCYQWSQTGEYEITMARPFNHIGPGQSERFVLPDFAKQLMEISVQRRDPVLSVGDIDVTRDFTDVRDIVRAYRLLIERGANGEVYNVCSGREYSIRSLLLKMMDMASVGAEILQDSKRMRPSEQRRIFGSFNKLRRDTGWQPEIPIEKTLIDILDDWRNKLS